MYSYLNGSILIATIQPAFTIQHTLPSSRAPSKVAGLAWHGSSSKSKTDMLAAQTQDGDLRVWSVPKIPHTEQPMVIRLLNRNEAPMRGPNWFAWSKNGRIVQYIEGSVILRPSTTRLCSLTDLAERRERGTCELRRSPLTSYRPSSTLLASRCMGLVLRCSP